MACIGAGLNIETSSVQTKNPLSHSLETVCPLSVFLTPSGRSRGVLSFCGRLSIGILLFIHFCYTCRGWQKFACKIAFYIRPVQQKNCRTAEFSQKYQKQVKVLETDSQNNLKTKTNHLSL